jgi:replicative superfamily II helicase
MIGDSYRGYLIELMLTKINYLNKRKGMMDALPIQIIAMSATFPNLNEV